MGRLPTRTAVALCLAALLAPAAKAAPPYSYRVLANDLANPRGLLLQGDRLFVAEAGSGGPAQMGGTNCITSGAGTTLCSGFTGAIGAWDFGTQSYTRLLPGLPSLAQSSGLEGTGIADLASGGPTGLLGVFGFGGDPAANQPAQLGSDLFGQVVSIDLPSGTLLPRANLSLYEQLFNPDGAEQASNPYALQLFGGRLFATDAGGNTLITINPTPDPGDGSFAIEGSFAFPPIPVTPPPFLPFLPNPFPASAVPTGLAVNPVTDRLLIGELSGFPFVPGSASIYTSDGIAPASVLLSDFTTIADLAAAADGSLYVLEYTTNFFDPSSTGSVWRVGPGGDRQRLIEGLIEPTGLALGADGALYVTSSSNGLQGELREYRPVPAPLPLAGAALAWGQARRLRRRLRARR